MSNFHFSPRPNRANEIHWRDWDAAAFEQARQEDKPILLDLSAVWCHWCHVMDETCYSDPAIIQAIGERLIPIRVDTDERPDINRRYNLGGWPTTAFLTPNGELLTGGTYIPPAQMLNLVQQVSDLYRNRKQEILDKVAEVAVRRAELLDTRAPAAGALSPEIVDHVVNSIRDNLDSLYGGLGDEPKFPQTDAFELVLAEYSKKHDPSLLSIVTTTLTNMARGGIYDQQAGGFFRYSTTRDWSVPHYEKMLEDNAKLLALYLHAWQVTRDELFEKTIHSLIEYVEGTLADLDHGGFYGSQDADEHYYSLTLAERAALPAPYVDRTFYADWNALMVSAYLEAAAVLGEDHLQTSALKALDRLWSEMYQPDTGLHHYAKPNQAPQLPGQLSDVARTTQALLDAYQATGDTIYLGRAELLAHYALDRLVDPQTGALWSEPPEAGTLGLLRVPEKTIGENAAMAQAWTSLYRLTSKEDYRSAAERALAYFVPGYAEYSFMAADYARAVDRFLTEPVEIRIVGGIEDDRTRTLQLAALQEYAPAKLVQLLDPERDAERIAQFGYAPVGKPRAYVCIGDRCLAPVTEPEAVSSDIRQMAPVGS